MISILAGTVIAGSVFTLSGSVYAANGTTGGGNFFSGLITFIAQKFGLDKTKVQTAVQDYQKQVKATITPRPTLTPQQMEETEKKRLDPFVTQGKITQAQEDAILAELTTVRSKYTFTANETQDQRKTQKTNMQNELKTWAQGQGIDPTYLMSPLGRGPGGGGKGPGFRGRMGPKPSVTP